jgi:N-acetylneuraminate synthase
MTHLPLVRYIANKNIPAIISTGTANLEEVDQTVKAFLGTGNHSLMLMQCTASYPAPIESLNLRAISTMKQTFQLPVGLSDHSQDPLIGPLSAVALGANLIEKHFTLSRRLPGPDHSFSIEPSELNLMVKSIREVEQALGNGEKITHVVESELRGFARRSIFATNDIHAGDVITPDSIAVLRCGNIPPGLEPKYYDELLGKVVTRDIPAESAIHMGDYA